MRTGEHSRSVVAKRVSRAIRSIKGGKRKSRGGKARRWALAAAVVPLLGVVGGPVRAADRTWDGGGASDDFTDALNWAGDVLPVFNAAAGGVGDNLIFAGTTRLTPFNNTSNTNQTALSLRFAPAAGAFNIGGNLVVVGTTAGGQTGNGNITNQSANTVTFGAEVRQRTGLVDAAAGDIVFDGMFGLGNTATVNQRASTFTGPFNTYLNGKVTMSGALTRQGSGITFITNDTNDYIGETRIQQGVVRISAPNALGSFANGSARTVISGDIGGTGRLELVGGYSFAPEPVTLGARQGPSLNAPHIVNVSGNNTWTGTITLATGGFDYLIQSAADKLTISGNINSNLTGVRNLRFGGTAEGEVSGSIGTGMGVFKEGPGTWTFSNAQNTYGNGLTVNGGTLILSGVQSTSGRVVVNSGTLKMTPSGRIDGTPRITVNSSGTLDVSEQGAVGGYTIPIGTTLEGTGTVKGPVNVQLFSTVAPGMAPTPGTLSVDGGVSFTGNGNASFSFGTGAHSMLNVTGDVSTATSGGPNNINILGSGLAVGNYDLIKYTGALTGEGFAGFALGAVPPRASVQLVNDTAGKSIDLQVSAVDFPRWIGNVSSEWDVNTTPNWREVNSETATTYLQPGTIGDTVLFDDQATNPVVNIGGSVAPAAVTFNNNAKDYLFTGGGGIGGPAQLVKNGTGKVVLANTGSNEYAGGTVVNAGTLQIGDDVGQAGGSVGPGPVTIATGGRFVINRVDALTFGNALVGSGTFVKDGDGTLTLNNGESAGFSGDVVVEQGVLRITTRPAVGNNTGAIIVLPGGTFDVVNQQMETKRFRIAGAGYNGQGAIISSSGQQQALQNVTLTADATIGAPARMDIRNLGNPTILSTEGNAYNLTKVGAAQFSLVGVTVDPAMGDVNINEGILSIEVNTTGLGDPNKTINIAPSGHLQMWRQEIAIDKKIVSEGGIISSGSGTQSALVGLVTLNANTNFINAADTALTLTNVVSGAGGVIKGTQTGTLNLPAANTYTGPTQIGAGAIVVRSLANGGQASGIGQSAADAANLVMGGGGRLAFVGPSAATTDRLFTVNEGGAGLEASGAAGAPVVFSNPGALVMNNSGTAVANLTLSGSNADANELWASISDGINGASSPVALVKSGAGTWVVRGANTFSGATTVNGGMLRVTGSVSSSSGVTANNGGVFDAAASQRVTALTVNDGGRAVVTLGSGVGNPTVLTTGALTIGTNTAQVDLRENAMVVDYAPGASPIAAVRSAIASGYADGAWNGAGIVSSTAATNASRAVGYAEASSLLGDTGGTFLGQQVDGDSVLVRHTVKGDANLDGSVTFPDLVALAQNYNTTDGTGVWNRGDFTYDGNVTFPDLVALAQNYGQSLPTAAQIFGIGAGAGFEEDLARAFAQVPEPGSMALVGVAAALMGRRRRRR